MRAATSIVCLTIVELIAPLPAWWRYALMKHTATANHRRKVGRRAEALFALLSARHASRTEVPPQGTNRHAFAVAFVYPRGSNSSWKRNRGFEMRNPTVNGGAQLESVVPFASTQRSNGQEGGADQLDKAGQSILHLLHRAAGVAEENSRHALDMAQKLSHQLRAAEDRIAELEAEVTAYQDRAERAEQWLHKVYTEIEDRFLQQEKRRSGTR